MINVSPKVRFSENIKIQSELRFRGYSMNTLNTYRRRPWLTRRTEAKRSSLSLFWYCMTVLLSIRSHSNQFPLICIGATGRSGW